ncbi:unnamed protein product [Brassica rapa subsp. trilocularis]
MELPATFLSFYSLMLRRSQQRSNLGPGFIAGLGKGLKY